MVTSETLEDFYKHKHIEVPANLKMDAGHFNVFNMEQTMQPGAQVKYARRDFYKVMLIRGNHVFHYAEKSMEVSGSTLLFFNPQVPYKFERLSENTTGYFCIFTEAFFSDHIHSQIKNLPMYMSGTKSGYVLTDMQDGQIVDIFKKITAEIDSDYPFKYDLIRSYIMEMVHFALKMQPSETLYKYADANSRITGIFNDLLERQFPIESTSQQLKMRSAKDYAELLCVHVNHLNRAIRTTTGKTTTSLISGRILTEAKALLLHTNWNIAEISFCLGFDEPAHFNHFFKKQTNATPSSFRM
jgi:AraC family transcriptional activator of pobA